MPDAISDAASVTALWHLAWESARSNPATLVALISAVAAVASAITALTATLVTPLVSFWIARRQIRATLVSANRQAWINALRDDLSELFELLTWLFLLRPGTHSGEEGYKYVAERRSRIRMLRNRIRLRLNPDEPASRRLLELIEKIYKIAGDGKPDNEQAFTEELEAVVLKSQEILKTEWKRVKKGR